MIYIKKITDIQEIYIPRTELDKEAYITSVKTYEDGYNEGLADGKEQQKDNLLNLYVTKNGVYNRNDGYGTVTVDVPTEETAPISLEKGSFTASENGEYVITPTEGFDGLESLNLRVDVPQEGGNCNLVGGNLIHPIGDDYPVFDASQYGYDGFEWLGVRSIYNNEWQRVRALVDAYNSTEQITIDQNGTYSNADYRGTSYIVKNFLWFTDIIPTEETDVELWVKPLAAENYWTGFIGSQNNDDDLTTFQIRRIGLQNVFEFRFGNQIFEYPFEEGKWYRLRMNKWGVWVNGEQVTSWEVNNYVSPDYALAINGINNPNWDNWDDFYRVNYAEYGYIYFHNLGTLLTPDYSNAIFLFNNGHKIQYGNNRGSVDVRFYSGSLGYNKIDVNVPQEGGNCNIGDLRTNFEDLDGTGRWWRGANEDGLDGYGYVEINANEYGDQKFNQGYEQGYNDGQANCGEGGGCNIQNQKRIDLNGKWETFYPDEGYDGIFEVVVDASIKAEEWREEGRWDVRNKLKPIEITENGRYSVEDQILVKSLKYNGGYHTDTISTYDINRIEVTFKADTSESINGQAQPFILGGSMWGLNESGEDNACARAIQYSYGRIIGYWEGKWTNAEATMDGEWITIILDVNGMTVKYPTYERYCEYLYGNDTTNSGSEIFPFIIGGQGRRKPLEDGNYSASLIEDTQFRGLIKEVKINTNSMGEITYIPKNWGYGVWDRKVENTGEYLSALEPTEGEVLFNDEWESKYGEGWKEINVNVTPKIRNYEGVKFGHSTFTDCPFNIDGIGNYDYMFSGCESLVNAPIINTPISSAVSMFSGCESLVNGGDYDTSNATDLRGMYSGCRSLQYVGSIDCSSLPNREIGFGEEAQIFGTSQYIYLTDFGGFTNLKQRIKLQGLVSLNEHSVINIFNGLYDFVGNNETPNKVQGIITMSRFLTDIVEAHKSIAENKGWTIIIE